MRYTVDDCREASEPLEGYHCCSAGPDTGFWVNDTLACSGESRDAGYVWRFTTANIPQIPYVVEGCDEEGWLTAAAMPFPSPTPWREWRQGLSSWLNAEIAVRFSMDMDNPATGEHAFASKIRLLRCGSGDNPDCDSGTDVASEITPASSRVLTIRTIPPNLESNTWYRVMLLDGIQSSGSLVLSDCQMKSAMRLWKTRPAVKPMTDVKARIVLNSKLLVLDLAVPNAACLQ